MEVTIQALAASTEHGALRVADRLAALVDSIGGVPRPLFPGALEPELRRFYLVSVADEQAAERVIATVTDSLLADCAYVKPAPHRAWR